MSDLAKRIATAPPSGQRVRRGPSNQCENVYEADLEDAQAIIEFQRRTDESWVTAQKMFDALAGVTTTIPNDKFRYHWRRKCWCWPDEQRLA